MERASVLKRVKDGKNREYKVCARYRDGETSGPVEKCCHISQANISAKTCLFNYLQVLPEQEKASFACWL